MTIESLPKITIKTKIQGDEHHGYYIRIPKAFINYNLLVKDENYEITISKP